MGGFQAWAQMEARQNGLVACGVWRGADSILAALYSAGREVGKFGLIWAASWIRRFRRPALARVPASCSFDRLSKLSRLLLNSCSLFVPLSDDFVLFLFEKK